MISLTKWAASIVAIEPPDEVKVAESTDKGHDNGHLEAENIADEPMDKVRVTNERSDEVKVADEPLDEVRVSNDRQFVVPTK